MTNRYSRWDGTQEVASATPDEVMGQLADELLEGGDLRSALRRLLQRGAQFPNGRRLEGLQELVERLRRARERRLEQYDLSSIMDDIQKQLDRIIDTERQTVRRRLKEGDGDEEGVKPDPKLRQLLKNIARQRLEQLDRLPPDVGGRIKQLQDYDFMDPQARQQFDELMKRLQQQVLNNYFQGLQQGIQSLTPEALRQTQQMVHDLNHLLEQRLRGDEPDFQQFMEKWGQLFPQGIQSLDQLVEHLQRQMAQMASLLKSMTPEMRQQLEEMIDSLLRDHRLRWDLMQLAANLERLHPRQGQTPDFPFSGDEPLTLQEALKLMGDLNSMDGMERELTQAIRSNDASHVDADEIGRLLGEEARRIAQEMQRLTQMLEEAGLIRRKGNDWELTPRAIRKIGERALQEIFGKLKNITFGDHNLERGGSGMERLDETKPYAFGDPFLIDSQRSVMNAVIRQGAGTPVHMKAEDLEVYRTMSLTQCSTVIMLDMSYSMMMDGAFQAGRKVALALNTLIHSKFPKDNLYVVAFSYFVLTLKPEMLLNSYWVEYGGGTNIQDALRQARLVLAKHKVGTKQIILITDGQPTTYSYWGGGEGKWSRSRYGGVAEETLREVARCTRENITINTFMMDRSRHLTEFVRVMTKVNRGRAFFTTPHHLGEYILLDYVNNKRQAIR